MSLDNRPGDQDKNDSVPLDIVHVDPHPPSPQATSSNVIPLHGDQTPEMDGNVWEPPKEVLWLGHPMAILALMIDPPSSTIGDPAKVNSRHGDLDAGFDEWEPPKDVIWLGHLDVLALCQRN